MRSSVTIKDWREEERPRERLMSQGAHVLSDAELIAILLHTGDREHTAVDVSRMLLCNFGNTLSAISKCSLQELTGISGIGKAKASVLMAAFEMANRINSDPSEPMPEISSPKLAAQIISPLLKNLPVEECWILYLNRGNRLIGKERVSIGGISSTIMESRVIIKKAIEKLASGIILVHNHPSGNPKPGEADRKQTLMLKKAAALVDIILADHIIIAGEKYYSFADSGTL